MDLGEKERCLKAAMEMHGDYLKRLVYSYVKDLQKTEDIVQDVFVKFYIHFDSFEKRSSVKTFLYRIAVNEAQNYLRSWSYRKIDVVEKIRKWTKGDPVEESYINKEQAESVASLINMLPVKYREVLWLFYYIELSIQDIAEVLDCSPNTVKTRLVRGRKLAKISIEEGEYEY
ncbi:sigma-70 family RNA polymerase sigma factor [Jeotgalibacillus sp. R-1-5s-1]|uniref:sigma-70 family RNA polymerase sigma factor n=1 Tax=Jeotgalibacillus sp. R-1-5s-1 TaxID=2555897 RepID=UPI00106CA7DE|nr:sigma-70 family RNA polymerase sigma factor [Jeotgalibacillus sp. R-1-5s-1]TFD94452.1 sigma-70 family RNA polymerase sigma factor [Jeotgalibacillus sp. R-1-5s-1]